ncbi:MAG: hypothetical protein ACI92S_002075, partial [Planctomycetaceae bacterium]
RSSDPQPPPELRSAELCFEEFGLRQVPNNQLGDGVGELKKTDEKFFFENNMFCAPCID